MGIVAAPATATLIAAGGRATGPRRRARGGPAGRPLRTVDVVPKKRRGRSRAAKLPGAARGSPQGGAAVAPPTIAGGAPLLLVAHAVADSNPLPVLSEGHEVLPVGLLGLAVRELDGVVSSLQYGVDVDGHDGHCEQEEQRNIL